MVVVVVYTRTPPFSIFGVSRTFRRSLAFVDEKDVQARLDPGTSHAQAYAILVCVGTFCQLSKDGFNMVRRDTSEIHAWPARLACLLAWSPRGLCVPVFSSRDRFVTRRGKKTIVISDAPQACCSSIRYTNCAPTSLGPGSQCARSRGWRRRGPRPLFSSSWLHVNYALDLYRICGGVPL